MGTRTFLHPTIAVTGLYEEPIEAFYGAPQTAASHAFAHRGDDVGFFMESRAGLPGARRHGDARLRRGARR